MPTVPTGYDPVLLNHWLWYKYRCAECAPAEFQVLFENIVKRIDTRFMSVRPYGNIGDRKCDGLFFADEASTVFQVYAPDELKQEELLTKINEDLGGAVLHWSASLKSWIFVYNVRRGVPPDVAKLLLSKRTEYPNIELDQWSSDALWEKVRAMPLQKRAEILGAPSGYEHLFFTQHTTDEEIKTRLDGGSFVLVQDLIAPISLHAVSNALAPAAPFGAPLFIRPRYGEVPWTDAAIQQRDIVRDVLERGRGIVPRFSVFSLAPIPLAVHLGFLLSDRVQVDCFQFDRDNRTWKWPAGKQARAAASFSVAGLPTTAVSGAVEISISIALSAPIADEDVRKAATNTASHIQIGVKEPSVMWLRSRQQLTELAKIVRETLTAVRNLVRDCTAIHIFYAGPTGGAIVLGQAINPRMNPPVHLYQYSQQSSPRYQQALVLTEDVSL
jgi:hypothetical protein